MYFLKLSPGRDSMLCEIICEKFSPTHLLNELLLLSEQTYSSNQSEPVDRAQRC